MPAYDTWTVRNTSTASGVLAHFQAACTVSNGYLGVSGHVAEHRDARTSTRIAGVFDEVDGGLLLHPAETTRPYIDPRYLARLGRLPSIANLPCPLAVRLFIRDREVALGRGHVTGFVQSLHLNAGVYAYRYDYRDAAGTTRIEAERFASLTHAHRVHMRYRATPVDHSAPIRALVGIDADVASHLTREPQFEVTELWADPAHRCRLTARTPAQEHEIRMGVESRLSGADAHASELREFNRVYAQYTIRPAQPGVTLTWDIHAVLTSSTDRRHGCVVDLDRELSESAEAGYDAARAQQQRAWAALWDTCDVRIDGDDPAQLGLRFCLFHVLQAAPRFSERLSVPARFLTGEAYQGATFYDTDLLVVPFHALTNPAWARHCLNFRHAGLRPARLIARQLGLQGAKFAWQAGPEGEECLAPAFRCSTESIHINADVAAAVTTYVRATHDRAFLAERGVDLLVEAARFYASRARFDAARGTYDFEGVTGPDEGHCGRASDFYTNTLARATLRWAANACGDLAAQTPAAWACVAARLALGQDEPPHWRHIADRIVVLQDRTSGVFEQSAGFRGLRSISSDLRQRRRVEYVDVSSVQACLQPAVVMALALLRDEFDIEIMRANWAFYRDKSLDFASTSYAFNAILAATVGDAAAAYRSFVLTCGLDLDPTLTGRHDTYAGVHGAACAGAWAAAVFGFGGVHVAENGLRIDPRLPAQWSSLQFKLAWRGARVSVRIGQDAVRVATGAGDPAITLRIRSQALALAGGEEAVIASA